jgi:hypothetical protein
LPLSGNLFEVEFLQNLGLTQRKTSISVLVVERHDHVLDLASPRRSDRSEFDIGTFGWRGPTHLVSPEEAVTNTVLEAIPNVQELFDPVLSHMIGMLLSLVPRECSPQGEQTHVHRLLRRKKVVAQSATNT